MKTVIKIYLVVFSLSFVACKAKKDYTCVCQGGFSGSGMQKELEARNLKAATKICTNYNSPNGTNDGLEGCEIK